MNALHLFFQLQHVLLTLLPAAACASHLFFQLQHVLVNCTTQGYGQPCTHGMLLTSSSSCSMCFSKSSGVILTPCLSIWASLRSCNISAITIEAEDLRNLTVYCWPRTWGAEEHSVYCFFAASSQQSICLCSLPQQITAISLFVVPSSADHSNQIVCGPFLSRSQQSICFWSLPQQITAINLFVVPSSADHSNQFVCGPFLSRAHQKFLCRVQE